MRVLHVLDHSLPYFSGYSFRSDYIIRTQKSSGLEPFVVTSPKHEDFAGERETIDGIDYYRLGWPAVSSSGRLQAIPLVKQMACVAVLSKKITALARSLKIDIVHAHSPSLNGLAAARAAHELGLPWIYELRYYDEDAAVDRGKIRYNSLRYRMSQRLEQSALEQSTRIATISSALRADLVRRGIKESKIFEVPNGVDVDRFQPAEVSPELLDQYGLRGKTVIGFIGSLYYYEGLDRLIEAALPLIKERDDVKVLIVGEGEAEPSLKNSVPAEFRESVVFAGKVPHHDVQRRYSAIDILVYPRISSRLTELTTPLKPLEAMAMGRAVVGSDVGGIRELIRDGETGLLAKPDDPQALADRLRDLIDDRSKREALGARARDFVVNERAWPTIVRRYFTIYGIGSKHKTYAEAE